MHRHYTKDKEYEKNNIAAAVEYLKKKPARQGSNQTLEKVNKPKEQKKN